jgi:hypothetical protein
MAFQIRKQILHNFSQYCGQRRRRHRLKIILVISWGISGCRYLTMLEFCKDFVITLISCSLFRLLLRNFRVEGLEVTGISWMRHFWFEGSNFLK